MTQYFTRTYVQEGKTANEIAGELGVNPRMVREYLQFFNIKRR